MSSKFFTLYSSKSDVAANVANDSLRDAKTYKNCSNHLSF